MAFSFTNSSSLSLNGGKTDISSDYAAVGEQAIIATQTSDLVVGGKGEFIGGALTTASPEDNKTVFKQGIETQDIINHSRYEGDSIQAGISIGSTNGKPQGGMNGMGYGSDGDDQTSTTFAGVTGMAGKSEATTGTRDILNEPLVNSFDEQKVTEELNAQTQITQAFDQERHKIKVELNKDEQDLRDAAKAAEAVGDTKARDEYLVQADKIQQKALIFDGISSALYGPNSNGAVGYVAKAVSPQIAYQIGQAFKGNDFENSKNGNNELAGVGSPQHILAHLLLGAAVSYATGNDIVTGGSGASAGEATAPLLSKLIHQKPTSELTAEQKDTISSIASLTGVAIGVTTRNVTDAVNAGETALVAVQENDGRMINGKWCDPGECDSKGNPVNRRGFSDNEAKAIAATIGIVVWPVGVLEAYLAADNDAEKLAILKTAFSPLKSRALLEVLENTQVAKSRANKPSNQTANRAGKTCSFRGDMLVKTISGYRPISEVRIGNMVLSKNEITGKLTYQSVSNHYNNTYNATVYITIEDSNGNTQTIVSNKIHPFFTQVNTGAQLPQSSERHNYQGNIDNAQWIDASNLKAGYQLLSEDGQWQVVQSVTQTEESLSAYNLKVNNDHTYFVTGSDSTYGVWVHNDCWENLDSFQVTGTKTENGIKVKYFIDDKGKFNKAYEGKDGRWYDPNVYPPSKPNLKDPARVPQQGSAIPYAKPVEATNGLTYKSNPKHTSGYGGGNGKLPAGIEPINSLQIFESSKALGGKRYSIDNKGEVHQFTNSRDSWHWAGGSADTKAKLVLDNITKSKLRDLFPKHKDNPRLQ